MFFANYFDEGIRLRYYLHNLNRRGWGFLYAFFQVGEKRVRISTKVKVKGEYWDGGKIVFPSNGLLAETHLHKIANEKLNSIRVATDKIFFDYLCRGIEDLEGLTQEIRNIVNPMARKKKIPQSILSALLQVVEEGEKETTKKTEKVYINKFKEFLKDKGLKDCFESVNQKNIISFRDYLVNSVRSSTAKNTLANFLNLLKKVQRKYDFSFNIDRGKIEPIKVNLTKEERLGNIYALTLEDLGRLEALKGLKPTEELIRDLFLLQCYCSVRFEDLKEVLNSNNMGKGEDGFTYSTFRSKKTDISYHFPLNNPKWSSLPLEIVERYKNRELKISNTHYNEILKDLAKKAEINHEGTFTAEKGGKKTHAPYIAHEKISSHWGRHTCITNLIRILGMKPQDIKYISGHSTDDMIEDVYTNLTKEDKISIISKAMGGEKESNVKPTPCDNFNIEGMEELESVLRFLDVPFDGSTFEEGIKALKSKHWEMYEEGVNFEVLKALFNNGGSMRERVGALKAVLDYYRGKR